MIDVFDASESRLRLAVAQAVRGYDEDELFACIADPDPILRTAAARALHVRGSRKTFEHALGLAEHPRHEMREIAAFLLGQLGTPGRPYAGSSFQVLARLMDDPYWEVRRAAAGAVGMLGGVGRPLPEAVRDRVIGLADDPSANVRASVAAALGTVDDPRVAACLQRLLDDPDPVIREDAELGLELHEARDMHDVPAPRDAAE